MNLVEQIFQQANAGSANGQGFGQFFAEGVQSGQRQQSLDIQKQQLAMEIAQAPLKQTLLEQDAQMNALKIEQGLRANQEAIEGHSLLAQYSKAMQGANYLPLESGIRVHSQFGLDHPAILNTPEYRESGKQLDERVKQASIEEYRLSLADAAQQRAEAAKLKAQLDAKAKADVMPRLVNVGGVDYINNPKSGHFEPINKTESKSAFISKHLLNFSKDNMVDPKEAAAKLGELYDATIAPQKSVTKPGPSAAATTSTNQPATNPAKSAPPANLRLGTVIMQGGKKYIYQGGDTKDPSSYVEARQ